MSLNDSNARQNGRKVHFPVGQGWCVHAQEHQNGIRECLCRIDGERQSAVRSRGFEQLREMRLLERRFVLAQQLDAIAVHIEDSNIVPNRRQTSRRGESDVTGSDDSEFHRLGLQSSSLRAIGLPRRTPPCAATNSAASWMSEQVWRWLLP